MFHLAFIEAARGKQRALILGDGDGRFLKQLMKAYPQLQIDCVEISGGMVAEMRNRAGSSKIVQVIHDNALRFDFPQRHYDIVFAHFFLDCFETVRVGRLVARVSQTLKPMQFG